MAAAATSTRARPSSPRRVRSAWGIGTTSAGENMELHEIIQPCRTGRSRETQENPGKARRRTAGERGPAVRLGRASLRARGRWPGRGRRGRAPGGPAMPARCDPAGTGRRWRGRWWPGGRPGRQGIYGIDADVADVVVGRDVEADTDAGVETEAADGRQRPVVRRVLAGRAGSRCGRCRRAPSCAWGRPGRTGCWCRQGLDGRVGAAVLAGGVGQRAVDGDGSGVGDDPQVLVRVADDA